MESSLRATFRIHAVFFHNTIQPGIVWRFHLCLHYQIKFAIMYSEKNSSQANPMSDTILTLNKIQQIVKPLAENTKSVKFIYSDHIHEKRRLLQAILIFFFSASCILKYKCTLHKFYYYNESHIQKKQPAGLLSNRMLFSLYKMRINIFNNARNRKLRLSLYQLEKH